MALPDPIDPKAPREPVDDWATYAGSDYRYARWDGSQRLPDLSADDVLDAIQALGDKQDRVMLAGHKPELTELANRLSSEITHMATGAIAEFTFDAKAWSAIGKAKPVQVALDHPKKP